MNDIDRALSQIADIRQQLATSTRFRGFPPTVVGLLGLASLVVTAVQLVWPERFAADDRQIVLVWGGLLITALLTITIETLAGSRHRHGGMAGAMFAAVARTVAPAAAVQAVVAAVILIHAPQVTWVIPGIWLMLIGVVGFANFSTLPKAILWPAAWYLASGVAVTFLAAQRGELTPLMVGVPLAVGHAAIAAVLRSKG